MSTSRQVWIGHGRLGGRTHLDLGAPGNKVLLLGSRAGDLSALAAASGMEAGSKPVVLDLSGGLSQSLSGRFDAYDYRSFLYDSFRLEPPEPWHSELVAAAYTSALDLSSEEEAIITSALQAASREGTMASPAAIYDVMGKVEGFRGFYVDKLKGRIGSLKLFDAVDDQAFGTLLGGNALVDFHGAPYPLAAELAASLFIAKLLALANATGAPDASIILTSAHRVFRNTPRLTHGSRLLTQFLCWPAATFFATDQVHALSPHLLEACPVRIYSSDAWHSTRRTGGRTLSGTYVLQDGRTGWLETFVPRRVAARTGEYAAARPARFATPALTLSILETVERFPLSTRESVVHYLAPEYLASDVNSELTNLQNRECMLLEPKDSGAGPKVFAYTLTEKGKKLAEELSK